MDDQDRSIDVALGLMRKALALLDKARVADGTPQLRYAVDQLARMRSRNPGDELAPDLACLIAGISLQP